MRASEMARTECSTPMRRAPPRTLQNRLPHRHPERFPTSVTGCSRARNTACGFIGTRSGPRSFPVGVSRVRRVRCALRRSCSPRTAGRYPGRHRGPGRRRAEARPASQDVRSGGPRPHPPDGREPRRVVPRPPPERPALRPRPPQLRIVVGGGPGGRPRLRGGDDRRPAACGAKSPPLAPARPEPRRAVVAPPRPRFDPPGAPLPPLPSIPAGPTGEFAVSL